MDDPEILLQKRVAAYEQRLGRKLEPELIAEMRNETKKSIAKRTALPQATPEELDIYKANFVRKHGIASLRPLRNASIPLRIRFSRG